MLKRYYSNGKLLLSGEYLVLDGALSLGLPTQQGQFLEMEEINSPSLTWKSLDVNDYVWFECTLELDTFRKNYTDLKPYSKPTETQQITQRLLSILAKAKALNPNFLDGSNGFKVRTKLTFPREWGLGTSSTLINNIAQWAGVNAFELLWDSLGGSGYDVACAQHKSAILYRLEDQLPKVMEIPFQPAFQEQLYFVYQNKKQNSSKAITDYRGLTLDKTKAIAEISEITREMATCKDGAYFSQLMEAHENIMANILGKKPVKNILFPDFPGAIKSLGAWGGDFILAMGDENTVDYFTAKKFPTVIPYGQMVL